jgi:hypothetical protein
VLLLDRGRRVSGTELRKESAENQDAEDPDWDPTASARGSHGWSKAPRETTHKTSGAFDFRMPIAECRLTGSVFDVERWALGD